MCRGPLPCPLLGTWPATQACALTGESNWGPFGSQLALNPLSYTAQSRLEFKEALPSDDLSFIMLRPSSSMLKEKRLPKKLAVCAHGGGSNQVFKGTWG